MGSAVEATRMLDPNPERVTMNQKMRLLNFGSKTCGACLALEKAKTLARFQALHPQLQIVELLISNARGDSPALGQAGNAEAIDYERNYKLSDDYEVTAIPTLILEVEGGGEVARMQGPANVKQLEALYQDWVDCVARGATIPW